LLLPFIGADVLEQEVEKGALSCHMAQHIDEEGKLKLPITTHLCVAAKQSDVEYFIILILAYPGKEK
jgi:hypothetical protein